MVTNWAIRNDSLFCLMDLSSSEKENKMFIYTDEMLEANEIAREVAGKWQRELIDRRYNAIINYRNYSPMKFSLNVLQIEQYVDSYMFELQVQADKLMEFFWLDDAQLKRDNLADSVWNLQHPNKLVNLDDYKFHFEHSGAMD